MRRRSPVVSAAARNPSAPNSSSSRRSREFRPHLLALSLASAFAVSPVVLANPTGGVAIQGSATFVNSGNQLTVTTQNGAGMAHSAINWQSFSIPGGSTTSFVQPSTTSTVINNVITNNPSAIFGTLQSNGRVVLVNQSGITVGAGAVVDTAGFTASALGMSQDDAKAGRMRFGGALGGSTGAIQVQGNIIARGGDVVLIAPNIEVAKTAVIEAQNGTAILAAGQKVEVTGRGLEGIVLQVQAPSDKAVNLGTLRGDAVGIFAGQLRHSGLIQATGATIEGGRVVLKASDLAEVDGTIQATRTINGVTSGGSVKIDAPIVTTNGTIQASGVVGGTVEVTGGVILQGGRIEASGTQTGGDIKIVARNYVEQTASTKIVAEGGTGVGGNVTIQATEDGASVLSSAEVSADGAQGGSVKITAPSIGMYAASVHADGTAETNGTGGSLEIGGGFHGGDPYLPNSRYVFINSSSVFSASSRRNGAGGTIALWSDGDMKFSGLVKALGGSVSGNGGFIEVSGKEHLVFRGSADASAVNGAAGTLLLDPTDITIVEGGASGGTLFAVALNRDDTGLADSSQFGDTILSMNGVLVVTDPYAYFGGNSNAGAIYVFNPATGALIGALHGSHNGDYVGSTYYSNFGNYNLDSSKLMYYSQNWNNYSGALTVFNPVNLVGSMVVSASNSLVGNAGDQLGSGGIVFVNGTGSNDAIVMGTTNYGGGAGAITILKSNFETIGAGGVTGAGAGTLSSANSLVGSGTAYEYFGSVTGGNSTIYSDGYSGYGGLSGGFYFDTTYGYGNQDGFLIVNKEWSDSRGAVIFVSTSGATPTGTVGSATNVSLRGTSQNDHIGENVYYTKTSGATDWLIGSPQFDYLGGGVTDSGALTYVGRINGYNGIVDEHTSIVGTHDDDHLGADAPIVRVGNKMILRASDYDGGKGAVGVVNIGATGELSSFTLETGLTTTDHFGSDYNSFFVNSNGDFMQIEGSYNGGEGGVFWYDTTGARVGLLRGGDDGAGTTFNFGNTYQATYQDNVIILTSTWTDSSSNPNKGAITVVDRHVAQLGEHTINASNSVVGTLSGDSLGSGGVQNVSFPWWAVSSPDYNGGIGAVTIVHDSTNIGTTTGIIGSNGNLTFVGTNANDLNSVSFISNYTDDQVAMRSTSFAGGAGAVTLMDLSVLGAAKGAYQIDASNSLVGTSSTDNIASNVSISSDQGHVIIRAPNWGGGKGAVAASAWDSGGFGTNVGNISGLTALVGALTSDNVGSGYVREFSYNDAPYIFVSSPNWSVNSSLMGQGAISVMSLDSLAGVVSSSNSVIGAAANDHLGPTTAQSSHVLDLSNQGKLVVASPSFRAGAGAVTWIDLAAPSGVVNLSTNSLFGASPTDNIGSGGFYGPDVMGGSRGDSGNLDFNFLASPFWSANRGALTTITSTPIVGAISNTNSFVGAVGSTGNIGYSIDDFTFLENGAMFLRSGTTDTFGGAWTLFNGASSGVGSMKGELGVANSIVGASGSSLVNSFLITSDNYYYNMDGPGYNLGDYVVLSQRSWGGNGDEGAVRIIDTNSGLHAAGSTDASNSLVGANAGDQIGYGNLNSASLRFLDNVTGVQIGVASPKFNGNQGAFTVMTPTTVGVVSSTNSLLGLSPTMTAGDVTMDSFGNGNLVVGFTMGNGSYTFIDRNAPLTGVVDASNSLLGGAGNDGNGQFNWASVNSGSTFVYYNQNWNGGRGAAFTMNSIGTMRPVGDMSNPIAGVLTGAAGEGIGENVQVLNNTQFVLSSSGWGGGRGALTWGDSATGFGSATAVSESNSLVGHTTSDNLRIYNNGEGANYGQLSNGAIWIGTNSYNGNSSAYAFVNYGSLGDITTKAVVVDNSGNRFDDSLYSSYHAPINLGNGNYALYFYGSGEGSYGQVYITDANPNSTGGVAFTDVRFNDTPGDNATITNGNITAMTAAGTNVLLQASNDINVNAAIVTPAGQGTGGGLTLQAGRSVNFNANVFTRNGSLDVTANSRDADVGYRSQGAGGINIASGVSVNAGSGAVNFTVDSEGVQAGNITINGSLRGGNITLTTPADVVVEAVGGSAASIAAQNLAVNATSMAVIADAATASVSTVGTVNINLTGESSTLTLSGGSGDGASASIVSGGNASFTANTIELNGGSGANAYALLDPTDIGSTMTVSTIQLLLNGGSGNGSYAALVSTGGDLLFVNPLPSIFFNPGTGVRADAVIYAPNGDVLARQFSLPYLGENSPFSNQIRDSGFAKYRLPYNLDQGDFLSGLDFIFDELSQRWRRRSSVNGVIAACSV